VAKVTLLMTDVTIELNAIWALQSSALDLSSSISAAGTLEPGLYYNAAAFGLAAGKTLKLESSEPDASDRWIILIGGAAAIAGDIVLGQGVTESQVTFAVNGAFSLGAKNEMFGNVFTPAAITVAAGAKFHGRLFSTMGACAIATEATVDTAGAYRQLPVFTPNPTPQPSPPPGAADQPNYNAGGLNAFGGINLGTAREFTVLTMSGITNVPTSNIEGDMGVSPIAATGITGFSLFAPLITSATGEVYSKTAQCQGKVWAADYLGGTAGKMTRAINDMKAAYTEAANAANYIGTRKNVGSGSIGGSTLTPGVYSWTTNVNIATDITLSGDANDVRCILSHIQFSHAFTICCLCRCSVCNSHDSLLATLSVLCVTIHFLHAGLHLPNHGQPRRLNSRQHLHRERQSFEHLLAGRWLGQRRHVCAHARHDYVQDPRQAPDGQYSPRPDHGPDRRRPADGDDHGRRGSRGSRRR
jgi:hypothetical protein